MDIGKGRKENKVEREDWSGLGVSEGKLERKELDGRGKKRMRERER